MLYTASQKEYRHALGKVITIQFYDSELKRNMEKYWNGLEAE